MGKQKDAYSTRLKEFGKSKGYYMDEAIIVFSRSGEFKSTIRARDIPSREHARKLWPMVAPTSPPELVTWVSPCFDEKGRLKRRSHFRLLPNMNTYNFASHFNQEENRRRQVCSESQEHRLAKELIAAEIARRYELQLALPWYFKDESASEYPLSGNLLLGADRIETEYRIKTPFDCEYRLDVAVLAKPINREPIVLGGIEIELGHAFEGRKALIGKSQGFPLISIDITEMELSDITPKWAETALTATTRSNLEGRRQTYIYLHDLMYPLYIQLPDFITKEPRHQFIVFAKDDDYRKLKVWLAKIMEKLELSESHVALALVNAKSQHSKLMLENCGNVVGAGWKEINNHQCMRITVNRPANSLDKRLIFFHLALGKLLLSHVNALVGYKYQNGINNDDFEEDIWLHPKWNLEKKAFERFRVLPKRLAEPSLRLINMLNTLGKPPKSS